MDLPKTFDEFVDARKQGFMKAKENWLAAFAPTHHRRCWMLQE